MYSPEENESLLRPAPAPAQTGPLADLVSLERLGWILTTLIWAASIVYIAQLTSFPLQDYPNHLARGTALADLLFHQGERYGQHYEFHFALVPYLLHDLLLAGSIELFGTAGGAALFSTIVLVSFPCALLFYMHVNNLAPRARLLVFLLSLYLSTDWFFLMGFMAFRLALAMVILSMALADLLRKRWSPALFIAYLATLVLGYLIHLTSIVFFAPVLVISAALRLWFGETHWRREASLLIPVVLLLGVHFGLVAEPASAANPPAYAYMWAKSPVQKLINLRYEFERFDGRPAAPMMIMLAVCLLWPIRRALNRDSIVKPEVLEPLTLAAAFLALYIVLPQEYADSSYVDVRALPMITLFVLLVCLNLPEPRSGGVTFDTLPVLALATLLAICNLGYLVLHLGKYNADLSRYREVVAHIPQGASVLPVSTRKKHMYLAPFLHAGSLAVLDREAVIPYLFSGDRGDPMKYFRVKHRPYTPDESWYLARKNWNKAIERTFEVDGQEYRWRFDRDPGDWYWYMVDLVPVDWNRIACGYEFLLLTQPFDPDLIQVPTRAVATNAAATLLKVDNGVCHPGASPPEQVRLPSEH